MNYILHGKRFLSHLSVCATLLLFAANAPQTYAQAPGGVNLNTPGEGATINAPADVTFTWSGSSPAADWYHLWISKDGATYLTKWVQSNSYFAMNGLPGGNYMWWVRTWNASGGDGPWSMGSSFSVVGSIPSAVTLISPVDAVETNSTINYTWTQDASSTWYEIFIAKDGKLFKNLWFGPTNSVISGGDVTVPISGHTSGNYMWWVRPWGPDGFGDWSTSGSFIVQASGEPGVVTLVNPGNGATTTAAVTLQWTETDPPAQWFYIFMSKDGARYFTQWTQTNFWTFSSGLPSGNYTWWVRPWNQGGYGLWSSASTFTVIGGVPTNVFAVSPVGDVTLTGPDVSYVWTDDPAATWYQLYVSQNNRTFLNRWFSSADVSFTNSTERIVTIANQPSGNYMWWIRGWSPDGYSEWSTGSYRLSAP